MLCAVFSWYVQNIEAGFLQFPEFCLYFIHRPAAWLFDKIAVSDQEAPGFDSLLCRGIILQWTIFQRDLRYFQIFVFYVHALSVFTNM